MIIEGQVGIQLLNDGAEQTIRMTKLAALVVQQLHGRYYEQTYRRNIFSLTLTATTTGVAAGNISAAAAAASTQFALWNPVGNSVNLVLTKVFIGLISGTPAPGPLIHNLMLNGVSTIASVGSALNNFAGGNPPSARYVASAAGTALTGGGLLTPFRPATFDFSGAFAAAAGTTALEIVDGDIIIAPGFGWVPCFAAAGTTLLNTYGVTWEETPI